MDIDGVHINGWMEGLVYVEGREKTLVYVEGREKTPRRQLGVFLLLGSARVGRNVLESFVVRLVVQTQREET